MIFSKIPGLESTKRLLIQAVRNKHLPHAQLFGSAEGALNLPMALALATYLHCEQPSEEDACGTCAACSKSLKYIHPDTHFVFPVSNVKLEKDEERFKAEVLKSWRSFLLEQPYGNLDDWTTFYGGEDKNANISKDESREIIKTLALKPFESRNKVMVIWGPEYMHPSAANGILKILEEPSPDTYFILVSSAPDQLLSTITSRTQMVTIPCLSDAELASLLIDEFEIDPEASKKIAHLANGNINEALRLCDNPTSDHSPVFIEWMRSCFKHDYQQLLDMAEEYHKWDKMAQRNLMSFGLNMLRETLINRVDAKEIHRIQGDDLAFVEEFSKVMSLKKVEQSYYYINEASYHLDRNGSAKMIFMDLSLKLSSTLKPN